MRSASWPSLPVKRTTPTVVQTIHASYEIRENDLTGVWIMRSARRWGWSWGENEDGARSEGIYSTNGSKLILMNTEYTYSLTGNTLKTMFRQADAYGEHNSDTTFERIR